MALSLAEPLSPALSRDLDLMTCSVHDIVNHFAQTWRDIADAIQHNVAILARDPCDLGRARAVRTLACAGRVLRMVECARIRLYRFAHPGERIPRAATQGSAPIREQLAQSGREARDLRKIGRAREQEAKSARRAARDLGQTEGIQSTGFSLPNHPQAKASAPGLYAHREPIAQPISALSPHLTVDRTQNVRSTAFSLPNHPQAKASAPGLYAHREPIAQPISAAHHHSSTSASLPRLSAEILEIYNRQSSGREPLITPDDIMDLARNPQIDQSSGPLTRAERRRRERLLRKGRTAPS